MVEDHSPWFEPTRDYMLRLVGIRSVSPSAAENDVVREVMRILGEGGLESAYAALGLDPIEGDPYGRVNAYAFLRGASPRTIVLLGHIDTVPTADYGALEDYASDPQALHERRDTLAAMTPGLAEEIARYGDDLLFGRGTIDMKAGVAANLAVMRALAERSRMEALPLSVVLLATPDEENESAGVLQAVRFLLRLREEHGLEYLGAINTDYTTARYPDDPHRYVFTGTIGKLLPSFLVIGKESHVGDPFDGVDADLLAAELIADLSMNPDLCDVVRGQKAPPPVTLRATDLKVGYDVQLPFAAYFYLNVLTLSSSPAELLERLRERTEATLARVLEHLHDAGGALDASDRRRDAVARSTRGQGDDAGGTARGDRDTAWRGCGERRPCGAERGVACDAGQARAQPAPGPAPLDTQRSQRPSRRALLFPAVLSTRAGGAGRAPRGNGRGRDGSSRTPTTDN